MATPSPSDLARAAAAYGVPRCFIVFVLGMSVPARTTLRVYLEQMLDMLEGKIEEWIASKRRSDKISAALLSGYSVVSSKLDTAQKATIQIPVEKITTACSEAVTLIDTAVKGVGALGVEGVEDLQSKADDILYEVSRLNVVSTSLARARDSANAASDSIRRWINVIDSME